MSNTTLFILYFIGGIISARLTFLVGLGHLAYVYFG